MNPCFFVWLVPAAVAPPCRQGATFPGMVVSLEVGSSRMVRVPDVASLVQCVAAGCDLPAYNLVWLFQGSCYVLNCQQGENCRLRHQPNGHSTLAFLQRALVLPQPLGPSPQSARLLLDTPTMGVLVGQGGARGRSQEEDGMAYSDEVETESLTGDDFNQSQPAVFSERGRAKDDLAVLWNSVKEADDLRAEVNPEINMKVRRHSWKKAWLQSCACCCESV